MLKMSFPGGSGSKNLPAMQVPPLGWEDPLEEGKATHTSILAWEIPWTEVQSIGLQRVTHILGSKITADGDCSHEIKRCLFLGRKTMTNLDSILKSRDITLPTKVCLVKAISSSHVWMWELDYKESWVPKNWCFWTVVLEKTLESPLDHKEIQPVNPQGNHSWIFTERTDAEAETPILWPPDSKNWLIGKEPDSGKGWRQEEKGMTEDEMVGWLHQLNGHEFEQALGGGDGQGSLTCCRPWGHKELDTTEWLTWTDASKPSLRSTRCSLHTLKEDHHLCWPFPASIHYLGPSTILFPWKNYFWGARTVFSLGV